MQGFCRMRKGGFDKQKVDLDGYEKKAARQGRQVAAKARRSMEEPKIATIECSRSSGRSSQPWRLDTARCLDIEVINSFLGLRMMTNSLQNIINSRPED